MRRIVVLLSLALLSVEIAMGSPREKIQTIPSRSFGASRTFRVYLPPSYQKESSRHYPVLYLHDGQNVFSSAGTNIAFGWGS
ncbi:MAG: alpha/beta hydrolase-fold protein, partial [Verrucomicrobiota bacterium]